MEAQAGCNAPIQSMPKIVSVKLNYIIEKLETVENMVQLLSPYFRRDSDTGKNNCINKIHPCEPISTNFFNELAEKENKVLDLIDNIAANLERVELP